MMRDVHVGTDIGQAVRDLLRSWLLSCIAFCSCQPQQRLPDSSKITAREAEPEAKSEPSVLLGKVTR